MSPPSSADRATSAGDSGTDRPIPAVVDWVVAGILALFGLLALVFGSALAFLVDRPTLADAAARGDLQFEGVSRADGIEILGAVSTWTGIGMVVLGIALVVAGVAYLVSARRAASGEPADGYVRTAVLGAVVSALLSFLPFSPAIGGALAGYLEHGASGHATRAGALSGLLLSAPVVLVLGFVFGGLASGLLAVGASRFAAVVVGLLLFAVATTVGVGAGLGAVGGYAGGLIAADDAD